jgi:ABC-type transporter Mla maintaining outer membrane lipid asymmetry permease subunit MlaE
MDTVALSALILSILGLVGGVILKLHLSHCKSGCFESDCTNNNNINDVVIDNQPKLSIIPIEVVE